MDFMGDLYGALGVSEPLYLLISALVALLLAFSLAFAALEAIRINREYSAVAKPQEPAARPAAAPAPEPAEKPPEPGEEPKADITKPPAIDVVKPTLPESIKAMAGKYGLDSVTFASFDGLVIASSSKTPDEDAAVYSNLFHELYRTRPGPYYHISNKDIHLLLAESGSHRFIVVARKPGQMPGDEASGVRDDSGKIVEKFSGGGNRS
jgi:hypothetical protein